MRTSTLAVTLVLGTLATVCLSPREADAFGRRRHHHQCCAPVADSCCDCGGMPLSGGPMYGAPPGPMPYPGGPQPMPSPGPMVAALDDYFRPPTINVPIGGTVRWTNQGQHMHTVTADDGSFDSKDIASGASFSHKFEKAGTFKYHCTHHRGMTGTVVVGPPEGARPMPRPPEEDF